VYTTRGTKEIYFGECKSGTSLKHGMGISIAQDGSIYQGSYKDNHQEGYGRKAWPNGEYFQGKLSKGKYTGCAYSKIPSNLKIYHISTSSYILKSKKLLSI
jgi:hypothetical protein